MARLQFQTTIPFLCGMCLLMWPSVSGYSLRLGPRWSGSFAVTMQASQIRSSVGREAWHSLPIPWPASRIKPLRDRAEAPRSALAARGFRMASTSMKSDGSTLQQSKTISPAPMVQDKPETNKGKPYHVMLFNDPMNTKEYVCGFDHSPFFVFYSLFL